MRNTHLPHLCLWILSVCAGASYGASVHRGGPPKILSNDLRQLQVVRLGQEFRVTCPIVAGDGLFFEWFKDGEPITISWSRFRVNEKLLRIRSILMSDSGVYECKGVNGFGSKIVRMRLVVVDDGLFGIEKESKDGPEPHGGGRRRISDSKLSTLPVFSQETLEQAGPMHLSSGNTIRFRCEAKGNPTPKVTWLKDGKPVGDNMWKYSSWTLILSKISSEDRGLYTCLSNNTVGKIELTIQLHVTEMIEKRRPELVQGYPNSTSVISGSEAVLECVVGSGFNIIPPHIKWLKRVPSEEVQEGIRSSRHKHRLLAVENQHVLVIQETHDETIRINETQRNGTFVSKLIFSKVESSDEGIYICLATNNVGFTFKEAKLTVIEGAEILSSKTTYVPFPVVVIGMSIAVAVMLIGSVCALRRHQELKPKKQTTAVKSISPRNLTTQSINSSSSSSSSYPANKNGVRSTSTGGSQAEQRQQLLVSTSMHSSSTNSSGGVHQNFKNKLIPVPMRCPPIPTFEIAMSRCSCCGDSSPPPPIDHRIYEHCFTNSLIRPHSGSSSHSHHSSGHWT